MAGLNAVVAAIRARTGGSEADARKRLDGVLDVVVDLLVEEGVVKLPIGSFRIVERKGGKGRNPRTGEAIAIAPRRTVKFKASDGLKLRVTAATARTGD